MTEYVTTEQECMERISGVCEGCGGELEPIETVDNAGNPTFWRGCRNCSCFRSGIERVYFEIARELVEKNIIRPYHHDPIPSPEDKNIYDYWLNSQTAGLSHIILTIHIMLERRFNGKKDVDDDTLPY